MQNEITISSAKYLEANGVKSAIIATIGGGQYCIPIDALNTDYQQIMRQVEAGTLVIQEAE